MPPSSRVRVADRLCALFPLPISHSSSQYAPSSTCAAGLKEELKELKSQEKHFLEKEAALAREEALHPKWNVDNISKDKSSRTVINKVEKQEEPEDEAERMSAFFKKYGDEMKVSCCCISILAQGVFLSVISCV